MQQTCLAPLVRRRDALIEILASPAAQWPRADLLQAALALCDRARAGEGRPPASPSRPASSSTVSSGYSIVRLPAGAKRALRPLLCSSGGKQVAQTNGPQVPKALWRSSFPDRR